jgi:polysaccharide pyruvyl transferase WcaK-like protein
LPRVIKYPNGQDQGERTMNFTRNGRPLSCLLLGYGGAGNTGSDVRLMTILDDVRECFGDEVRITIGTQNREKTLAIIPESEQVKVVQIPYLFMAKVRKLAREHDVTFLVEGSTFKQNWSRWLLYAYLWGAWCAKRAGNHCVAYAVDAGELSPFNAGLTRRVCNEIDLLITRTEKAKQRLKEIGVTRPVFANTDSAFRYQPDEVVNCTRPDPQANLRACGESCRTRQARGHACGLEAKALKCRGHRQTVGIAPIEFFQWPVTMKWFGRKSECYRWPFYFTWDDERRAQSARMIENFRDLAVHIIDQHDMDVKLIAMEELDTEVCAKVLAALPEQHKARVKPVSSCELRPNQMVPLLRGLDYLVTSRYHACVLSMAGSVPQMAVSHDERLASIYCEIGIGRDFLLDFRGEHLGQSMFGAFDMLVRCGPEVRKLLQQKHDDYYLPMCARNKSDLAAWAHRTFAVETAELSALAGESHEHNI